MQASLPTQGLRAQELNGCATRGPRPQLCHGAEPSMARTQRMVRFRLSSQENRGS